MNEDLSPSPISRYFKFSPVGANRIVIILDVRRIFLERIGHVEIDRLSVAVHLPVTGNRNLIPLADIIPGLEEILRPFGRFGNPMKLPVSVEG
ncbi:hypothetical protein ES703_18298 [subsurface metagenome]